MRETSSSEPRPVIAYRKNLPAGETIDFSYTGLDHLDMPIHAAALWLEGGGFVNGLGYGVSREEAMIGAFGELTEVASAHVVLPELPRVHGSYNALVAERGHRGVLDPLEACLEAGSDYDHDRELSWVEARRYATDETVLIPVEFAATAFGDLLPEERKDPLVTPITNGLGAGPDLVHALSHSLLELLQRDGNSVNYRALDQGVAIDLDAVEDPGTHDLLQKLEDEDVEVIVKLADTDFGMSNLYVVGYDRDPEKVPYPITESACGEAVHPDRETALRKALTEFVAARSRKMFNHAPLDVLSPVLPEGYVERYREEPAASEEDRSLEEMLNWLSMSYAEIMELLQDPVFAVRFHVPFSSLPEGKVESNEDLLQLTVDRLAAAGLDVLYLDYSPPGGGVRVTKALVPGLEVETVSYGRIGARNLRRLLERGSDLVATGTEPSGNAGRILLPEDAEKELGPAWLDFDALEEAVGRLYPLYREPARHVAALTAEERGIA